MPVAALASGALPDTCGDAAELLAPGAAADAIARARARRAELVARGRAPAALFTWRATAEATALVYREAINYVPPTRISASTRSA